jgi:hypothetical protein
MRRQKKNIKNQNKETSDAALVFRGPIRSLSNIQERKTLTKVLGYWQQLTATAGGVVNAIIALNPSTSPLWSTEYVGWDEYRLLGASAEFSSTNSSGVQPMVTVVDFDDHAAALASQAAGLNYGSGKVMHASGDQLGNKLIYKMANVPYSTFTTTGAAPTQPPGSFKTYSSNNSASVQTFQVFVSYLVQFRGPI